MSQAAAVAGAEPDLIVRREGSAGIIRLNRPKALNAMTLEMSLGIDAALDQFEADPVVALVLLEGAGERGLCAGGDIRGLWESSKVGGDLGKVFWRQEYVMNARTAKFPKPYVAFMDGLVMGGGVGLSAHSGHRVVTERTKLAMPEVGLGFFPDHLLGDDPEAEKARLREGFAALVEEIDFDHALFAHGAPIVGGARDALRQFAAG